MQVPVGAVATHLALFGGRSAGLPAAATTGGVLQPQGAPPSYPLGSPSAGLPAAATDGSVLQPQGATPGYPLGANGKPVPPVVVSRLAAGSGHGGPRVDACTPRTWLCRDAQRHLGARRHHGLGRPLSATHRG
jgi:hypothetical protein